MFDAIITGTILGLSAGLTPGPLMTLVVTQTLKHNVKEGIKVSLAPLITDVPIILLTLFILSKAAQTEFILGIISCMGGVFVLFLAYDNFNTHPVEFVVTESAAHSIKKGALVNVLSPYPYLLWFSVGGPTVFKSLEFGFPGPLGFLASFYFCLVGGKMVVAVLAGRSRSVLKGMGYMMTMRLLGLVLCLFSLLLFKDGLKLLGLNIL